MAQRSKITPDSRWSTKAHPDRRWLAKNATAEEFNAAFKSYADTQWGLPDFRTIRMIVEACRANSKAA